MHVMRTFLDEGAITFEGDFFRYSGLYTFARPVQERIPIKMGGMKGPRSFETAGEIADGLHQAIAYSREAYDYATEHIRIGAERAGRDCADLDIGAWVVTVVSEDGDAAGTPRASCARSTSPRCPTSSSARHGMEPAELAPVVEALGTGDIPKAVELFQPEYAEKLSVAGTPEEVVEKIKTDIQPAGVNHMILALVRPRRS